MSCSKSMLALSLGSALMSAGCTVTAGSGGGGGGGGAPTLLIGVTGRSIPAGGALAFNFDPEAGSLVTIDVQASTNSADPDFKVVRGAVDFQDLEEVPIADLVLFSANRMPGQEMDTFTPDVSEVYTLFVEDHANWPTATFSVTVTQR